MNKMSAGRSLVALLFYFATSVFAADEPMTAGDLQQICLGADAQSKAACRYYIMGVTEGMRLGMLIADGKTHASRPCLPDDISGSALELVVKVQIGADLMVNPEDRKLEASGLVAAIIVKAFPCRNAK
jgi:hypothetical protein